MAAVDPDAHHPPARAGGGRSCRARTKETRIAAAINLDGTGKYDIKTGIGFLDHMLEQLSRHSLIDITLRAEGDLHIDYHHTTEDLGIVLGECLAKALGDRAGIRRYGAAHIPMDETLTEVALDASNRPYLIWKVNFPSPSSAPWTPSCSRNGSRPSPSSAGSRCTCGTTTATTTTTSSRAASRASRARCASRARSTRARPTAVPSTKGVL